MEVGDLSTISYDNELSFYTDKKNIPNQELVQETIEWFEKGAGGRVFAPLVFLNLLWKQYRFITENIENTSGLISHLQSLPLNDLQKHILFGLILKWFGGYPLEAPLGIGNSELYYEFRKRLLSLFLTYSEETPEKEFCKADIKLHKKFEKLKIAFNTSLQNNISVSEVLNVLNEKKHMLHPYKTFPELFEAASKACLVVGNTNAKFYLHSEALHNYKFNVWLGEYKEWEYGNDDQYRQLLTLENFKEYCLSDNEKQKSINFLNSISGKEAFQIFIEQHNALRNTFRIKRKASKEDCEGVPGLKESDIITYEPDYKTSREAFVLLTEYYAKSYLEFEKYNFVNTYKSITAETIRAEISELEQFISSARNVSLAQACRAYGKYEEDKREFVFKRLENGYYENLEIEKYP